MIVNEGHLSNKQKQPCKSEVATPAVAMPQAPSRDFNRRGEGAASVVYDAVTGWPSRMRERSCWVR